MPDVPGTLYRGENAAEPAKHMVCAEDSRELVGGLNAVLQGDHERAFAGERAHCLRGVGDLPGLHA